jgi:hypothetical protein
MNDTTKELYEAAGIGPDEIAWMKTGAILALSTMLVGVLILKGIRS